ncbi:MAG TPA: plastocyanin/azurin family copper-binding protein [Solirubrobacteraceae bacterium]|nr:plastocyanin/azurin family copper-binding protein [Solirubrobacteraceae bacterium]
MRKLLVLAVTALLAGALAATALAATKTVKVGDDWFVRPGKPTSVSVTKNTTVVWKWVGDKPHNVTVTKGPVKFRSTTKASGTYRKKVTRAGTYTLVCTVHGSKQKMTLRVR